MFNNITKYSAESEIRTTELSVLGKAASWLNECSETGPTCIFD